jgi:uncharacterized GH25 family protein
VKKTLALAATMAVTSVPAVAHTLWINVVPQGEKHVVASIGYGDAMPGSEILTPDWGAMTLDSYDVVSPAGERSSLGVPKLVTQEKRQLSSGIAVQPDGDIGVRKLIFGAQTSKGTYQLAGQTPLVRLVTYRDKQGKEHTSDQPSSQLRDVAQVLKTELEVNFMKAAFTVGGWTEPQALGQALEIVPLTDLSEARAGDLFRFKVLLNGKALIPHGHDGQITAHSASFGNRWGLQSTLEYGEGEVRIPQGGLWRVDVTYTGTNADVEAYRGIETGKAASLPLLIESSFVFNVRP